MLFDYSNKSLLVLVTSAALCTAATAFVVYRNPQLFSRSYHRKLFQVGAMKELPEGVVKYSQVPRNGKMFTATTIPKGLLREHNTKVGTWGVIRIHKGKLQYQINEPQKVIVELGSNTPGIIEPQIRHQVAPVTDDVEFVVEFYRYPKTGPVDEQREGL